jgi:hypothetical protein
MPAGRQVKATPVPPGRAEPASQPASLVADRDGRVINHTTHPYHHDNCRPNPVDCLLGEGVVKSQVEDDSSTFSFSLSSPYLHRSSCLTLLPLSRRKFLKAAWAVTPYAGCYSDLFTLTLVLSLSFSLLSTTFLSYVMLLATHSLGPSLFLPLS